ncbi:hypothetical protein [Streptomyces sp. VRA16 Mangrove soil]|uniref:hypothetical protein n=1 Tax=Streptomyces sp. VRA16 Mangrove soil TaxID=2817434 RepID=UPI001A9D017B|nr:hypothetical protein [Streptomyces sp. VRA16 Mangrove soil]MBO1337065.1 hypothetical protein [Streptomyces sp. VRA16 Mangrove soil]
MTVDPSDPETFTDDTPEEIDVEAPEADAAEQSADLTPDGDDVPGEPADPDGSNEADRAEQARVVSLDEDDYR